MSTNLGPGQSQSFDDSGQGYLTVTNDGEEAGSFEVTADNDTQKYLLEAASTKSVVPSGFPATITNSGNTTLSLSN